MFLKAIKKLSATLLIASLILMQGFPTIAFAQEATASNELTQEVPTTPEPSPTESPSPQLLELPSPVPTPEVSPSPAPEISPTSPSPSPEVSVVPSLIPTPSSSDSPVGSPNAPPVEGHLSVAVEHLFSDSNLKLDLSQTEGTSATLITDKPDYSPTDVVVVNGSRFTPNTNYSLIITSNDPPAIHFETEITADSSGNFVYTYQLDGNYRPNYQVEVKDQTGQIVASTIFTDTMTTANITVATGGSAISADTTGTTNYTSLTGPILSEGTVGDIGVGTIVLNAPAGFEFRTTASVTATRTNINNSSCTGSGNKVLKIGTSSGTSQTVTPTSSSVTISVAQASAGNSSLCRGIITWSGIAIRPTSGILPASGNIWKNGTSFLNGLTNGINGANFGTLTEVAGAASKLAIQTQPSSPVTAGAIFTPSPQVAIKDKYNNIRTSDSIAITATSNGSASLQGTTTVNASSGVATFSSLSNSKAETINIVFSSGSLTNATSGNIVVNPAAAASLKITGSSSMTAGYSNELTITAKDQFDNVDTNYTGSKNLTFVGPGTSSLGNVAQVESTNIGTSQAVAFTYGATNGTNAKLVAYKAESTAVNVSDGSIGSSAGGFGLALTVNPTGVDVGTSTLSASPSTVPADGFTPSIITATLNDQYGNPISNKSVSLAATSTTATGVSITQPISSTNASGQTTGSITASGNGNAVIQATDTTDNLVIGSTPTINFTDTTPPHIVANYDYSPNIMGWNKTNVTLSWTITPNTGIITSGCGDPINHQVSLTDETLGTVESCSATSQSGTNLTTVPVTIKIDKTPPVIVPASPSPSPNNSGWNNSPVTVGFSCVDTGTVQSGIDTSNNTVAGQVLDIDGFYPPIQNSGSCIDNAGNVATIASVSGINIDQIAPDQVTTPSTSPSPSLTNSPTQTWNWDEITTDLSGIAQYVWTAVSGQTTITNFTTNNSVITNLVDGVWNFFVHAVDSADNIGMDSDIASITVDTTAPIISAHAAITNFEATSADGAVVTYTFPVTSDAVDGPGVATCLPASGSTFPLGDTKVTCNATDMAGNFATLVTFIVNVVDTTPPVITLTGASNINLEINSPFTDPGASATDAVDGTDAIIVGGAINTAIAGTYILTYNATDATGNPAIQQTRTVTVGSTTIPLTKTNNGDGTFSATVSSATEALTNSGGIAVTLNIPANTTITGPAWNGILTLPTATTTFTAPTPDSGFTALAISAIEIGAGDTPLTFDQAVKLTFTGKAGNLIGWSQAGTFHQITDICNSPTTPTLTTGADCKINVGSNLVVWTKHFTQFVTYTQTKNPEPLSQANPPTCTDQKPGSAPTLTSAVAGTNSVTLTWSRAGNPVSYYLITYGTGAGLQQYGNPNVGGSDTTSYTVSGLSGGTTYYFKVRAGNNCAPGDYSNEISATPGGGFVAGPAAGFAAGVLGAKTSEEEYNSGEVKGVQTEPQTTQETSTPTKGTGFGGFIQSIFGAIFGFIARLFGR